MSEEQQNGEVFDNEGLFEGCGREGPIRAIFLSEFHHIAGPKIVVQHPEDSISKETFDALSTYIIPKTHLQRLIMTVNAVGRKILGYPIQIKDEKYERNAYYFNTCFVCDAWARTVQYEAVLIKFAEFFHSLELEIEYLSKLTPGGEKELQRMFENVITGLNGYYRECSIVFRDRLLKLKVVREGVQDPPSLKNHEVPVLVTDVSPLEKWDLTTRQILPYVDGFNHVLKIAHLADIDANLVKICLQNLFYYRVIKIVPLFLYGNTYYTTSLLHSKLITGEPAFKAECLSFVARNEHTKPQLEDVVRFYCAMRRGVTIKDLCSRFRIIPSAVRSSSSSSSVRQNLLEQLQSSSKYSDISLSSSAQSRTSSTPATPLKLQPSATTTSAAVNTAVSPKYAHQQSSTTDSSVLSVVDERRLVLFGLIHGLIRKVEKYLLFQLKSLRSNHPYSGVGPTAGVINGGTSGLDMETRDHVLRLRKKFKHVYQMFDGAHTYDEICLAHNLIHSELDEMVDHDPAVVIIYK